MPGLTGLSLTGLSGLMGNQSYIGKVLGYDPFAYWLFNETAGATAADQVNSPAQDGAYTGVTLANALGPDNVNYAPFFDGANDYVDLMTASLSSAFDGSEGSSMLWVKVFNAGVWTDGAFRTAYTFYVDANNAVNLQRSSVNNRMYSDYQAGGLVERINVDGLSSTDWMCWVQTWSATEGNTHTYYNGTEVLGSPQAIAGVWAGNLTRSLIGALTAAPARVWHGWLTHCALWDSALSPAAVADLAIATG